MKINTKMLVGLLFLPLAGLFPGTTFAEGPCPGALQLAGGTMCGNLNLSGATYLQNIFGTLRPTGVQAAKIFWQDSSDSSSGLNSGLSAQTVETNSGGSASFWSLEATATFRGKSPTRAGATYVGVFGQGVRGSYAPGGVSANPGVWGSISDSVDLTDAQSSLTGPLLNENDLEANGIDDANMRQNLSIVLFNAETNGRGRTGLAPMAWDAIHITAGQGASYKYELLGEASFDVAGIDLRNSQIVALFDSGETVAMRSSA